MHDDVREIKENAEQIIKTVERLQKTFVKDAELMRKLDNVKKSAGEVVKHIKERAEGK